MSHKDHLIGRKGRVKAEAENLIKKLVVWKKLFQNTVKNPRVLLIFRSEK